MSEQTEPPPNSREHWAYLFATALGWSREETKRLCDAMAPDEDD